MKVDVEVRIQMKDGRAVVLDSVDAKELFEKLKELYAEKVVYAPSYWRYTYPNYTTPIQPLYTWGSSSGAVSLSCGGAE